MCHPAAPIEMKRRLMVCHSVRRVPPPKASSSHRVSLYSSTLGASARVTLVSIAVGVPTQVSFTVPTVPRLPSTSNGAHSRRCAGSVSACQTFSGGWPSSLTRMSVHFSPSFRTCAPLAGPGVYCWLSVIFSSLSSLSLVSIDPCGRGGVREHLRERTRSGGTEPTSHPPPGMVQVSAVRDASPASTVDSTKPASRSTRRCFDTVGCGMRSWRSISPTDCWDETRRLKIARRFGSAMISNTDSMLFVYSTGYIRVKAYFGPGPRQQFQSACGDAPSDAFLAGAIQSAARSVRRGDERNSAVAFVPGSLSVVSEARRGLPEHGAFKSAFHQQFNRHCYRVLS